MIDHDPESATSDNAETVDEISKSQRKREADAIRELGIRLAELSPGELITIPLPDDVRSAIDELQRIKAHGARKRQLGYLAKRMRQIDIGPLQVALEKLRLAARANTKSLHQVEHWRDRLLGLVAGETEKSALTAFLQDYTSADRQHFRHLQRQALIERQREQAPAAARQLFKAIREIVQTSPSDD